LRASFYVERAGATFSITVTDNKEIFYDLDGNQIK
jgi:hypothetical protein